MPSYYRYPLSLALAVMTIAVASRAAEALAPDASLRANVEHVEDDRGSAVSGCRVTLVLFGEDLDDAAGVIRVSIAKAVDDLDRDVRASGTTPNRTMQPNRFARIGGMRTPLRTTIVLRNPSRRSTAIKLIEGSVDVYQPTEQNGAIMKVTAPFGTRGLPWSNADLQKSALAITYLTEEKAAELRRSMGAAATGLAEDEQRRLETVANEVARRRAERERAARQSGGDTTIFPRDARSEIASHLPAAMTEIGSPHRVTLQVMDPQNRFVGLEWRDPRGALLNVSGPMTIGSLMTWAFTEEPPKDAQAWVYVASDAAVHARPFRVENIALP